MTEARGAATSLLLLAGLCCHLIVGGWIPVRIEQNDTVRSNPGNRADVPRKQFGGEKVSIVRSEWVVGGIVAGGEGFLLAVGENAFVASRPCIPYSDSILLAYTKQSYRCSLRASPSSENMYTQACKEDSGDLLATFTLQQWRASRWHSRSSYAHTDRKRPIENIDERGEN